MPRRDLFIVVFAFALSAGVRVPQLNRPLSAHHELCTALVLIVLDNWHTQGFLALHASPATTFTTPADLYPSSCTDSPAVRDGVSYYFSHPPLAYDLPYAMFNATGIAPNAFGLELINLFFHLITALCLYLIVKELSPAPHAPLFAAVLYLFMPAPLWFHSNAYMSDMFVQNFWAMHVAVAMRLFTKNEVRSNRTLGLLALTLFLTMYTSWPGAFAAVAVSAVALHRLRASGDRAWIKVLFLAWAAVALALVLTVVRYLQVVDAHSLWTYYTGRFAVRGSVDMELGTWTHVVRVLVNYRTGYLPLLLLMAMLVIVRWRKFVRLPGITLFIVLAGLPVVLDHAFLLQYADHDFAELKGGLLLCGLAGIGLAGLRRTWSIGLLVATCIAGVVYFYRLNPIPGMDGGRYAQERDMGLAIGTEAHPNEAVFTLGFTPDAQVRWYAKRTLFRVDNLQQAQLFLRAQGTAAGVVFQLKDGALLHDRVSASE